MKCKKAYKDMSKYKEYKRRNSASWRKRGGAFIYENRLWTKEEDEIILAHNRTDRETSVIIKRSIGAIQKRRCFLKSQQG